MAEIRRTADAEWHGDSRSGGGKISSASGALKNVTYTWADRFDNAPGTSPEELLAAAHASCFSMALASRLAKEGHKPETIQTHATCIMTPKEGGGWKISRMRLETKARVPGLDENTFKQLASEAEKGCPVSTLLRPGLEDVELVASLV